MSTTDDGVSLARITIERVATQGDIIDHVTAVDTYGDALGLAEALGMLRLAEQTLRDPHLPHRVTDHPMTRLLVSLIYRLRYGAPRPCPDAECTAAFPEEHGCPPPK